LAAVRLIDRHPENVGRQHVGGELDALEAATDGARQRGGQRGLAHAGHVLDQQMAAREQADHRQPDDLGLAHQRARDVVLETADAIERRGHRARPAWGASDSGRMGSAVIRTPRARIASATALATAAGAPMVPPSPIPFTPPGMIGEGVSMWPTSKAGTSSALGSA